MLFGLTLLGLLLGAYTTGDLKKIKLPKYEMKFIPYKDRTWFDKVLFTLHWRKKNIVNSYRFHKYMIFEVKSYPHLWHLFSRKCPMCRTRHLKITVEHQNCTYVDKMSNYYWLCMECHKEVYDHYQELWDEYNAGRL